MKTKAQIEQEQRERDAKAFADAHSGSPGEEFGWRWLSANIAATGSLLKHGYDPSDPTVKAVASLAVRATLKAINKKK